TSKSGSTPEPRNAMLAVSAAYKAAGLDFPHHAVAVTGAGSALDKEAQGWLARFPMWDWVGGRTSEFSAVGAAAPAGPPRGGGGRRGRRAPGRAAGGGGG